MRKVLISASAVLWATSGGGREIANPNHGLVSGLSRTLRSENSRLRFVTLALANSQNDMQTSATAIISAFTQMMQSGSDNEYENELMELDGLVHTNRVLESW